MQRHICVKSLSSFFLCCMASFSVTFLFVYLCKAYIAGTYSLFTHECVAMHVSNSIIKFTDDTTVVGLITNNHETEEQLLVLILVLLLFHIFFLLGITALLGLEISISLHLR